MKRLYALFTLIFTTVIFCSAFSTSALADSDDDLPYEVMYRLYNPNSGEHFYTSNWRERQTVINAGWNDEQWGWLSPRKNSSPVYRLYNPNAGEHHYTLDFDECEMLKKAGWRYEGIGWYSDETADGTPVYREYNPNKFACNHNFTTDKAEHDFLVSIGWRDEGIAWYGYSLPILKDTKKIGLHENRTVFSNGINLADIKIQQGKYLLYTDFDHYQTEHFEIIPIYDSVFDEIYAAIIKKGDNIKDLDFDKHRKTRYTQMYYGRVFFYSVDPLTSRGEWSEHYPYYYYIDLDYLTRYDFNAKSEYFGEGQWIYSETITTPDNYTLYISDYYPLNSHCAVEIIKELYE